MTVPPAAAISPSAPGPVPPPVAGAPTGAVLEASGLAVTVGEALADGVLVPVADTVGELVVELLGVAEAEHVAEALALADTEAVADVLADGVALGLVLGVAEGEALVVGQLVADVALHVGLALADALAVLPALVLAEAGDDVPATAASPHELASVANAAAISRVAVPAARPTCPAHCSFSQPCGRDRRKILTTPWLVRLVPR